MDITEQANSVHSKQSFLEFVRALAADRVNEVELEKKTPSSPYGPGAKGWENGSIEAFLEAMEAWISDTGDKVPEKPEWNTFARILLAGKYYE